MHNQLHPHHLPGAAEVDFEEEMDEDPEMEVTTSEDKDDEGSDMDSDHRE